MENIKIVIEVERIKEIKLSAKENKEVVYMVEEFILVFILKINMKHNNKNNQFIDWFTIKNFAENRLVNAANVISLKYVYFV